MNACKPPAPRSGQPVNPIRVLLLFAAPPTALTLAYWTGWPKHFLKHPRFVCTPLNALGAGQGTSWESQIRGGRDAVVVLHSVFSNACHLTGRLLDAVARLPQPKAFFIGNEYKLMPEKMHFCETLGVQLLITMNPSADGQKLYRDRLGCRVACIPSSGLDAELFRPATARQVRPLDIGYRAFENPLYLGHNERRAIAEFFVRESPRFGLKADISLDPAARFGENEWADFLNRCKGQIGTEAGGDYFELTDEIRLKVNAYLAAHPHASVGEVRERFFDRYANPVPIRTISGRNVEAAGTKTVQILFEGYYSGYLKPDEHYIPLKKDFSNVDEAIAKFRDQAFSERIAENAYHLVRQELTYEKLIDKFYEALRPHL